MSSDYKGKNVFGADIYQGSDGIYHTQEEADRTWRSDYKNQDDSTDTPPAWQSTPAAAPTQSPFGTPGTGTSAGMSDTFKNRLWGVVLCVVGSWAITSLILAVPYSYQPPGLLFRLLSLLSLVVFWPARILIALMADKALPWLGLLFPLVSLANMLWLGLVGKFLLKKEKALKVFGLKHKKYRQLSWVKVSLLLLAVQLVLALASRL
ncbi:hypothetical protein KXR87_17365 [Yokenella regensburgei]|uniref:hypothetical protein n=1 Tax=Yokenella regensburgei TaxID=158877 RepID=UPI003F169F65